MFNLFRRRRVQMEIKSQQRAESQMGVSGDQSRTSDQIQSSKNEIQSAISFIRPTYRATCMHFFFAAHDEEKKNKKNKNSPFLAYKSSLRNGGDKRLDNASVNVEQVIASHARLPGHTSGNHNNVDTGDSLLQLRIADESLDSTGGVDVRQVSGNTGSVDDIVEGKAGDGGVVFEEEGERLADTASGSEDCDFL